MAAAVESAADALGDRAATVGALWQAKIFEYATLSAQVGRHADAWSITGEALDHALAALSAADPLLRARLMQATRAGMRATPLQDLFLRELVAAVAAQASAG